MIKTVLHIGRIMNPNLLYKVFLLISICFLISACQPISREIPHEYGMEPRINITITGNNYISWIVPPLFKETWAKKIDILSVDDLTYGLSPNGSWIVVSNSTGSKNQYDLLSTVPPYKTLRIPISSNMTSFKPVWSPDGNSFAVLVPPDRDSHVYDRVVIYHLDGEKSLTAATFVIPFKFLDFTKKELLGIAWSPDSTQVAVSGKDGTSKGDIYLLDQNARLLKEVKLDKVQVDSHFIPVWTATGLLFTVHHQNGEELRKYNLLTMNYQVLLNRPALGYNAVFNLDASKLLLKIQPDNNLNFFELLSIDSTRKTRDYVFQEIDSKQTKCKISSSNSGWTAILAAPKNPGLDTFNHLYLFNESNYVLIDYGPAEELLGWYLKANGFLVTTYGRYGKELDLIPLPQGENILLSSSVFKMKDHQPKRDAVYPLD